MTAPYRSIVTPEAVVLDLRPAGIASRALARVIDFAIQGALIVALLVATGVGATFLPSWSSVVIAVVGVAAIVFAYPAVFEAAWQGRTPGKSAMGLRVYTDEGTPIGWLHAFIRSLLQVVDFFLLPGGMFAVLSALFTARSQRLGDLVAGTLVLRERSAEPAPAPVSFPTPPGWEAYGASLDVGAVSSSQYRLVRSFLLRVHDLSPAARASLALRLAERTSEVMRHQPPPGIHPELFLLCVAVAYQRRHGGPVAPPMAWGAPSAPFPSATPSWDPRPPPPGPYRPPPPPGALRPPPPPPAPLSDTRRPAPPPPPRVAPDDPAGPAPPQ
jgi:uncharacterized RDD family membrane protein YckC